ncbi:hypothetical protein [Hymenobacter negativus]|uniref:Uncharacterized protein n=1 Tax=Hymenobacter negativus TaxID=2795026 RepID=A0ABS3QGR2_9BACT|nr:hypothetical protein [Hymenobacter negativus]MBO2010426.1 hypothetical protein [Hymenobacter negativus]
MQTESQAPPETRYLFAYSVFEYAAIQVLQADCVRNCKDRQKGEAYHKFIKWLPKPNELLVSTLYAYADLSLPKRFNCIFHCANPRDYYVLMNYELTQSVLNGWFPIESIEHGHRHFCVFCFEGEVPAIFNLLCKEDGRFLEPPEWKWRAKLGFCNVHDLPAITARWEKDTRLKEKYGNDWVNNYDEE